MDIHTVQIIVSCITNIYTLPLRITHDLGAYKIQPRTSRYTLEGVNNKLGRNTDFKVRCVYLLNRFNCQHFYSFCSQSSDMGVFFSFILPLSVSIFPPFIPLPLFLTLPIFSQQFSLQIYQYSISEMSYNRIILPFLGTLIFIS